MIPLLPRWHTDAQGLSKLYKVSYTAKSVRTMI